MQRFRHKQIEKKLKWRRSRIINKKYHLQKTLNYQSSLVISIEQSNSLKAKQLKKWGQGNIQERSLSSSPQHLGFAYDGIRLKHVKLISIIMSQPSSNIQLKIVIFARVWWNKPFKHSSILLKEKQIFMLTALVKPSLANKKQM